MGQETAVNYSRCSRSCLATMNGCVFGTVLAGMRIRAATHGMCSVNAAPHPTHTQARSSTFQYNCLRTHQHTHARTCAG
eukprot:6193420-Pleurochrysis_carterae.AAC.2